MTVRVPLVFSILPLMVVLGGCYESPDVTVFEPGVYKGKADPMLDDQQREQRERTLAERFQAVQTDR